MSRVIRRSNLILALIAMMPIIMLTGCESSRRASGAVTVIFARHAEKTDAFGDAQLTVAGHERARALVEALGDYGITAIYTSQFTRTKQTAAPLANHLNMPAREYPVAPPIEDWAAGLAEELRMQHAGGRVLVVGHSNTIAPVVSALTGGHLTITPIAEDVYNWLIIVEVDAVGNSRILRVRSSDEPTLPAVLDPSVPAEIPPTPPVETGEPDSVESGEGESS